MTDKEILQKAIDTYGVRAQSIQAIEEMAELTKVLAKISKDFIGKSSLKKQDLMEEYVDVSIMLEQLKIIYEITDEEYKSMYDSKMKRLRERIENE